MCSRARPPGPTQAFWSNIHTMSLPSIVLALGGIVVYFRLLRNDLISTLQEDFITMARSKSLGPAHHVAPRPAALLHLAPGLGRLSPSAA